MAFAKLFETEKYGQLLVKIDTDENVGPEVRIYFEPGGLGVCSLAAKFTDNDDGWAAAEKVFENITAEDAVGMVSAVLRETGLEDEEVQSAE